MLKKFYILIFVGIIFTNCSKRTECRGNVYSRHNVLVPGAWVYLVDYEEDSRYGSRTFKAKTDVNGHFSFNARMKRKHRYAIKCSGDSGVSNSVNLKDKRINEIDLKMEN